MKIINAGYKIIDESIITKKIEKIARVCYARGTEILTNSGFKSVETILDSDMVLTYNSNKNILEYQPSNMVVYNYEGDMICCNHDRINFCVTPNHRMYVSNIKDRQYDFLEAEKLLKIPHSKQSNFRIPKFFIDSYINNNDYNEKILFKKTINHGSKRGSSIESIEMEISDEFIILMAAYISEGHTVHGEKYGSGSYVQITQTENTELYDNIISALKNLGIHYRVDCDKRKPNVKWIKFGRQIHVSLFESLFGIGSKNKHLPEWFRKLSKRQLEILLHNLYLGDGSHNKTRHERYLSISERLLQEVQEIFILIGKNAGYSYNVSKSQCCYTEENHRDSWIIKRKQIYKEYYNDNVYCPSTTNGIVCVRYNNKTFWCGNCYKSEDKINEGTDIAMCRSLINKQHTAMLEHASLVLEVGKQEYALIEILRRFMENIINEDNENKKCYLRYTNYMKNAEYRYIISGNMRAWYEFLQYANSVNGLPVELYNLINNNVNNIININVNDFDFNVFSTYKPSDFYAKIITDMSVLSNEERMIHENISVLFTVDRGVTHELVRHRNASFAQESTRYCNYNLGKFGKEITVIKPCFLKEETEVYGEWKNACEESEKYYFSLLNEGLLPQQARDVLPTSIKADIVVTANLHEWKHILNLRACDSTGPAHPQIKEVMVPLLEELKISKYNFAFKDMSIHL